MSKLKAYYAITVSEYMDGHAVVREQRMDLVSRRVVAENMITFDQDAGGQLTAAEMALAGAAERVARDLGLEEGVF